MKAWIAAIVLVGVFASGGAAATDGNKLLSECQSAVRIADRGNSDADFANAGMCIGMVEGVRDTQIILQNQLPLAFRICFPENGLSTGQAVRVVAKYLHDNPAILDKTSAFLVLMSFQTAYPCK